MEQDTRNLQLVVDISQQITSLLDLDQLLSEVISLTRSAFDLYGVQILLYDQANQHLIQKSGSGEYNPQPLVIPLDADPSLIALAARTQQIVVSNDTQQDPAYLSISWMPDIRAEMVIPILLNNDLIGVLDLQAAEPGKFTVHDVKVMQTLAGQVAIALRNAQLFQAEQHLREEMEAVYRASMSLTSSLHSQEILEEILEVIFYLVPARDVLLFFYTEEQLTFAAGIYQGKRMTESVFPPRKGGLTDQVATSGEMIVVPHMRKHPIYANAPVTMNLDGAILGIPLKVGNEVLGVINIGFPEPRDFTENELYILRLLSTQASIAIYNARLFEAEARQRKEVERLRQQDRLYYEHLNQLKDDLLRTASHDLKNPIGAIQGYVELIEDSGEITDTRILDYLGKIKRGSNQMLHLVTDLLDLARLETGAELNITPTPLNAFLRESTGNIVFQAQQKNIALSFLPLPAEQIIPIDPRRMEQVLSNLLSNAVKYSPQGGKVNLSAERYSDEIVIRIQDTGYGIPSEAIPHLFERFYRVQHKKHQSVEGTGLGLAIVKAIVDQHHGRIEVESALDEGSTFSIYLPKLAQ